MTPRATALAMITGIVLAGSVVGFLARFHRKMDLEQWTVGGRGFGLVLVWLLMAGEIYTTFTFLGASGWAYSRGAPILFNLGHNPPRLRHVLPVCLRFLGIIRLRLSWRIAAWHAHEARTPLSCVLWTRTVRLLTDRESELYRYALTIVLSRHSPSLGGGRYIQVNFAAREYVKGEYAEYERMVEAHVRATLAVRVTALRR